MIDEFIKNIPKISGIFDTHAHYDDEKFGDDADALLDYLLSHGVSGIITCGVDVSSSRKALELSKKHNGVYAAVGFHPENLPDGDIVLGKIEELLKQEKAVALGEIGLDYHWDIPRQKQIKWFKAQLTLAQKLSVPVILHDRDAHGDMLEIIKEYKPRGVLHCFSGSVEMAKEVLDLGLYIGIGGVVTFKNARKTVEVAKMLPRERILLETDCPYLAPEPMRGKINHSGMIAFTAEKLAEIRGETVKTVLQYTRENVKNLFGI